MGQVLRHQGGLVGGLTIITRANASVHCSDLSQRRGCCAGRSGLQSRLATL